jgi:hypothetical protein
MATSDDNTRHAELKARCAALGFQLIRNTAENGTVLDYYVNDPEADELCFTGDRRPVKALIDFLAQVETHGVWWKKKRHGERGDVDALDRARNEALMMVCEIRELLSAAQTVDDDISGDGRIRACLDVASRQLAQLANDLDSVNFGKGGAA